MATTTTIQRRGLASIQPTSTAPAQPAPAAMTPAARPYKDFLTPALHRRFTNAALLTLAVCWAEAIFMSSSSSWLWRWFPLGLTGIRSLLLFTPALAVFIIRVMNMHTGRRQTTSGLETAVQVVMGDGVSRGAVKTVATLGWYWFSSWFFGEVFIWSKSKDAGLGWVDMGASWERPRVNENPVLLRSVLALLAVVQTGVHLARDYDLVPIEGALDVQETEGAKKAATLAEKLQASLSGIARSVLLMAFPVPLFCGIFYFLTFRHWVWNSLAYPVAKTLVRDIPPNNGPTGIIDFGRTAWQIVLCSAMLVFLWEMSNTVFTIYVTQAPLKKGQPLTSEIKDARGVVISKSRDPNGSLIRGLKAKKDVPRTFAFWELYLITTSYPDRRKTIFAEVDRKDGSTWRQVCQLCLAELTGITTRIQNANQPLVSQKRTAEAEAQRKWQEQSIMAGQQQQYGLPKIAQQKVYDDRQVVQAPARSGNAHAIGSLARSIGQSPDGKNPMAQATRDAIRRGVELTGGEERWSRDGIQKTTRDWAVESLRYIGSPGEFLRTRFGKCVEAAVLGVPFSGKVNIVHASRSLSGLAVASLQEDKFGQAAKDIPTIIRTYTLVLASITKFIKDLPPHWTDIDFKPNDKLMEREVEINGEKTMVPTGKLKEVKEVVDVLRQDLQRMLLAFGEYASSLGLTMKEVREAREAMGQKNERREMVKV